MKRFLGWASAAVLSVAGLAACDGGGGGGSGPVGSWTLDVERSLQAIVDHSTADTKKQIAALPADERAAAEKKLADKVEEARTAASSMPQSMQMTFDLKADHTATMSATLFGKSREAAATWALTRSKTALTCA